MSLVVLGDGPREEEAIQPLFALRGHSGIVNSFDIAAPESTGPTDTLSEPSDGEEDFSEFDIPAPAAPSQSLRRMAVGISSDSTGEVSLWDLSVRSLLYRLQLHDVLSTIKTAQWKGAGGLVQPPETRSLLTPAVAGVLRVVALPKLPERTEDGGGDLHFLTQCRNRKFYLWRILPHVKEVPINGCFLSHQPTGEGNRAAVVLVGEGPLPQCGFCNISVWWDEDHYVVAYPDDNNGIVHFSKADATGVSALPYTCDLSSGGSIKCGQAMALHHSVHPNGDAVLCAGYESGHIVIMRLTPSHRDVVLSVRAFPQPVTSVGLNWGCEGISPPTLILGSAEGGMQGAELEVTPIGSMWKWVRVCWERKLTKGAGSVSVNGAVVVIGGWDGLLRMYRTHSGSLCTVLPFHGTSAITTVGFFGQPSPTPPSFARSLTPTMCGDPMAKWVVFTSAAADHAIAVWCIRL